MSLQYRYSIHKDTNGSEFISIDNIYDFIGKVTIPDKIKGIPVKTISDFATKGNRTLKSVRLPDSIISIGKDAFRGCVLLANINFPKNLVTIHSGAFANCYSLDNVMLNNGLKNIGEKAFAYCNNLKDIVIPNTVINIDDYAFYNSCISSVTFGDSLEKIGHGAFSFCVYLKNVTLPKSLKCLDDSAFDNCNNLETVSINSDIKNTLIIDSLFYACSHLKEIITSEENKRLISINGVLYDKSRKTLVRFPPAHNSAHFKVPKWVNEFSYCVFEGAENIKSINILNTKIKNIEVFGLEPRESLVIYCPKDSAVEEWLKGCGFKVESVLHIDNFLFDLSEESLDKSDI